MYERVKFGANIGIPTKIFRFALGVCLVAVIVCAAVAIMKKSADQKDRAGFSAERQEKTA